MNRSTRWTMNLRLHVTLFTLALTSAGRASLVTWEFAGEITRVVDTEDLFGGAVEVGTPFFGSYTFESATPDMEPDDPRTGVYPAISDLSGHIGRACPVNS